MCTRPRIRKRETKINPREIQEVCHPDESTIRQNLRGFPRKMR
jgi:hypothetical protein